MIELWSFEFLLLASGSIVLGLAKAGFKGLGFLVVTLMALAIDPKASTGLLVPLLVFGDCMAIYTYRKDVIWKTLFKLLPWMVVGIILGVYVGDQLSLDYFKKLMSLIIFMSAILMIIFDRLPSKYIPDNHAFAGVMGIGAGFTTMVGNLAGAFTNLYFLALRFPKKEFIGTAAWLFFFNNLIKLPFHVFVWKTINKQSLILDLQLIIFVLIGFFIGLKIISYFSNALFKKYIIAITIIGAILIFIK